MTYLRFILPAALGVLIFLTPLYWDGAVTIGIGLLTGWMKGLFGAYGLHLVVLVVVVTAVMSLLGSLVRPRWITSNAVLESLFCVSGAWVFLRVCGALFGLAYLLQVGPALLISEGVAGAVFQDIGVNVLAVYICACLLLPLLTDYGLMEFCGTLLQPVFKRVFKLPGRAAIDALASIVGASAIGLMISINQYERGVYTQREASVIATNFSIVSLPFCLVIATVAGIEAWFLPWYGVVIVACLVTALVVPRLPPLSRKSDTYCAGTHQKPTPESSEALLGRAWAAAMERAQQAPGVGGFLTQGISNLAFFLFAVVGASLAMATFASLIVFHTPIFTWLGYPLVPVLQLLGLPEAQGAATALFSGFLDQFMPAIAAGDIDSPVTSFVLAGLSVSQLIFMSEVGVIILRSSLPLGLLDLLQIFLLRTVVLLPLLWLGALLVVG